MKFEDLQQANKAIITTPIKGKDYAQVNERIKVFRMLFPNGTISTEIIDLSKNEKGKGVCVIKATALNEQGAILGTGHAYEVEGSTYINNTSYIENAETSAVGRCLGMLGIGIDVSVASYDEVANATAQQAEIEKPKATAQKTATKATTKKAEPTTQSETALETDLPFEIGNEPAESNRDKFREFVKGMDTKVIGKIMRDCKLSEDSTEAEWQAALMKAIAVKAGATL